MPCLESVMLSVVYSSPMGRVGALLRIRYVVCSMLPLPSLKVYLSAILFLVTPTLLGHSRWAVASNAIGRSVVSLCVGVRL